MVGSRFELLFARVDELHHITHGWLACFFQEFGCQIRRCGRFWEQPSTPQGGVKILGLWAGCFVGSLLLHASLSSGRVCDFGFGVRVRDMQVGRGKIFVPCTSAFSDICGLVFGSGTLATTWRSLVMAADGKFEARCGVLLLVKHE